MYEEEPYQEQVYFEVHDGVEVAAPVLVKREKSNRYGSVEGLPDEELADPDELQRQIEREQWELALILPQPRCRHFNPGWDWSVDVDYNAFASVDFERTQPEFDKLRYKADKLNEEVRDLIIRFQIIKERIPGKAKYAVLRNVERGILDMGDIPDFDMYFLAELYLRIRRMQKEVERLRKVSRQKRLERQQKFWQSLG